MKQFEGKVAIITGASSGIGRATAKTFAAEGAKVSLVSRREGELAELADEIRAEGGDVIYIPSDISLVEDVESMVQNTVDTFGGLDYGVNNAGIEGQTHMLTDLPVEEWDRIIDINLKGTFLCMQYEARAILEAGNGGVIVNVGSINSFRGYPTGAAYSASKHGQIGLTTSASAELGPRGIRVNLVCPGFIDTPMHRRARETFGDAVYNQILQQRVHKRRLGGPEEIARTIVFLCSDDASYITGTTLTADGGFTLTV